MFGHPRGLFMLFSSELWERFSFYGMRALLILYMTKAMAFSDEAAADVYGAYTGFVYATPLIGGMIADRFLGYRWSIIFGGVLMALGQFSLCAQHLLEIDKSLFYTGLALLIAGNGFFKPNISTMVGKLYEPGDPRRDGGFTIFYMGINLGAFFSPILCGWIGESERFGYGYGFGLAGVGMVIGLIIFVIRQHSLGQHGMPPRSGAFRQSILPGINKLAALLVCVLLFIPCAALLLSQPVWVRLGMYTLSALFVFYILFEAFRGPRDERNHIFVILILIFFSIFFWACFEQAGSSMNLFADRRIDRVVYENENRKLEIPASIFQSVNALFIVLLAAPFSMLWTKLGRTGHEPSSPMKFALGLLQLSLGFVALVIAAKQAGEDGKASMLWLILAYFFHTTGELCVSPVGLSTMTKLAPVRMAGLIMGAWFLGTAFAQVMAGLLARLTGEEGGYLRVFSMIVLLSAGGGVVLLCLTPWVKRMMASASEARESKRAEVVAATTE